MAILETEPHPKLTSRPIPWGFVGMLALLLVVETLIAAHPLDFTTVWADDWKRTAHQASRRVADHQILYLGDSLVKYAVLPKQVDALTGYRSYNLALNAGTMPSTYFLFRQAIESGAKPKAVVADF